MQEKTCLYGVMNTAGATFVDRNMWLLPKDFGDRVKEYEAADSGAALFDVCDRGKVELQGPDALSFLHNICTNAVKDLPIGAGCEAFLCTDKAKVVAPILVGHYKDVDRDVVWLDFAPGMSAQVLNHLDHYHISERFEMTDRTGEIALLRVSGPKAGAVVEKLTGQSFQHIPHLHHEHIDLGTFGPIDVRRHLLLVRESFDIFCVSETAPELWKALVEAGAQPAGIETQEILRIEAGWPEWGVDIDENRFVVETGRSEAICYTKGCFLGQEPIVMARDRGHVNRVMMGLKLQTDESVEPGAAVMHDNEEVGKVTSAAVSPKFNSTLALAYVRRGFQEPGMAVTVDAQSAEVAKLPFV